MQDESIAISKAQLVIETNSRKNTLYPVPNALMLFIADENGIPVSSLPLPYAQQGQQSQTQQVPYVEGKEIGQNSSYTFDHMLFLQQLRSTNAYDKTSFYLSNTASNLFSTLNTAMIATENEKPKIKLNILYTKFR